MGRLGKGRVRLGRGNRVLAAAIAIGIMIALPRIAPAASTGSLSGAVPRAALEEFRDICSDLEAARVLLASGRMSESAFADTLLSLFARADSLAQRLAAGARGNASWMTLQRGTGYLIESIRENWVGIAARNGMSFAEADIALKAALAWRSDVVETATP